VLPSRAARLELGRLSRAQGGTKCLPPNQRCDDRCFIVRADENLFINPSWLSRRGGIAAEGPQPQTALWLNHIYYSAKPEPFV
jgi:hypothetical protein